MSPDDAAELRVEYCGEEYSARPGSSLTFGRSADIVIDDNRFLHRVLGELDFRHGLWWITNSGSSIAITLQDAASSSMTRLAPGVSLPLGFEAATLRFEAGGTTYEMNLDAIRPSGLGGDGDQTSGDDDDIDDDDDDMGPLSEMTTTTSNLPLTDDQFALLVALAGPTLRNEGPLPTNRQLASSLDWTVTKFNRKLDGLCSKFTKAGVTGLHGSADRLAKDRRTRLAEHVVHAGIVRLEHVGDAATRE